MCQTACMQSNMTYTLLPPSMAAADCCQAARGQGTWYWVPCCSAATNLRSIKKAHGTPLNWLPLRMLQKKSQTTTLPVQRWPACYCVNPVLQHMLTSIYNC